MRGHHRGMALVSPKKKRKKKEEARVDRGRRGMAKKKKKTQVRCRGSKTEKRDPPFPEGALGQKNPAVWRETP